MSKIKAALKLSSLTPESKVTKAQGIIDAMQASGNYPASDMPITYGRLQTLVDNLHNAILASNAGTSTSISTMHEQERILISAFNLIKAHVEFVANNTVDPTSMITSAGLQIAVSGGASGVSELTLETAGNGGVVIKVPRGPDEKAFVFEVSTDGTSFTKVKSSSLTKVTISPYTPGNTIYVRYYAITKVGETAISQVKSIIVL